jgi:hypothetical protein
MKAQEAFASMMREQVAPALRDLGLKGSGRVFSIPSDRYWALIGFQKSVYSSSEAVSFTVNLQVVSRESWVKAREELDWLGPKPKPNVRPPSAVPDTWGERLGALMPRGEDHWWSIDPDEPTEEVAVEVVAALRAYGLPAMKRHMA